MAKNNPTARDPVEVKCYGRWTKYSSRRKAMSFYLEAMLSTEGAESDRYKHVWMKLREGFRKCTDSLETTVEDEM